MNKQLPIKRCLPAFSSYWKNYFLFFFLIIHFSTQAQVIFTEYIDVSDNNDAIEITNVGNNIVNLNEYRLEIYTDGSDSPSFSLPLSGQLGSGGSVAYRSPGATEPALAGFQPYLGQVNGNDAWVIRRGSTIHDVFGGIGCSGIGVDGWSDRRNQTTKNARWVRMRCVTSGFAGDCSFSILGNEWVGGNNNITYSGLGNHNFVPFRADINGNTEICQGTSTTLTADPINAFSFQWDDPANSRNRTIMVSPNSTTTYSVTVSNGACQDIKNITVNVEPVTRLNLDIYGPFCASDSPITLRTNQDGISGSWSGPGVNGFQLNPRQANIGFNTITFTPNPSEGQCFSNNTTRYEVLPNAMLTLPSFSPICSNASPISLPTQVDGFSGVWSGSGVSNNNFNPNGLSGNITLSFNPSDNCAQPASTNINVQAATTPALTAIGPICELSGVINLPTTQQNITGTWSGNGVNNNQFNPNGNAGSNTLRFIPNPGQCAQVGTTVITVESATPLTPPNLGIICSSDSPINLGSSLNGVSGSWTGRGVSNNLFNPQAVSGITILNFSPNLGSCAQPLQVRVEVFRQDFFVTQRFDPICNTAESIVLNTIFSGVSGNWSGAIVNNNILNPQVTPDSYTLTFTSSGQCPLSQTQEVNILDGPTIANLSIDPAACEQPVGRVSSTIQGGQQFFLSYSLDSINFQTNNEFTNLPAGDYTYIVDDGNCVAQRNFTIEETEGSEVIAVDITTPATCNNNAKIDVIARGTGNLFYSLTGTQYQRGSDFSDLLPGDYAIIIRDSNFCFDTLDFNISDALRPEISNIEATPTSCGEFNGEIQITAMGTGDLEYSLDGVNFQNTAIFANLNGGSYTATVKDATGCTSTLSSFIASSEAISIQNISTSAATCGINNGNITVEMNNNENTFQYALNNDSFQDSPQFSNLAASNYTIHVRDENGCTTQTTAIINTADEPKITETITQVDACNENTGSVEIRATAGSTLQYALDSGAFQLENTFNNLAGGGYIIHIRDDNGCIDQTSITIDSTTPPQVDLIEKSDSDCDTASGTITINASGTGNLTYAFNGDEFTSSNIMTGLAPNVYTIQVQSDNGCTSTIQSITINSLTAPTINSLIPTAATCNENNGQINVSATSENGVLQYALDNINFQSESTFVNLEGNTYTVFVKDESGCNTSNTIEVATIAPPTQETLSLTPATCSEANGAIQVTATGGTGDLSYILDGNNLQSEGNFTNLSADSYQIQVRDEQGCTTTIDANLTGTEQPEITNIATQNTTCGETNGQLTISANDSESLQYSINGIDYQDINTFTNIAAGVYSVSVRNSDNCVATTSIDIQHSTRPQVQEISTTDTDCGRSTGQINIAANGGTGTLSYSLDNENFQHENTFANLPTGAYTIFIKDENDCTTSSSVNINEADSPTINGVTTSLANCENTGGSLMIEAVDAMGNRDLQYSIDGINFQDENTFTNLERGDYEITVRAPNACRQVTTATIEQTESIVIDEIIINNSTCEDSNGRLQVETVQANGVVSYSLDNQDFQNDNIFTNLPSGNYTVYVRDEAACTNEMTVTIDNQGTTIETFQIATTCDENNVGNDTLRLNSVFGCDSLVITNKVFVESNETELTSFSCDENTLGRDTVYLQNIAGCDSLVITETLFSEDIETYLTRSVCKSDQIGQDTVILQSVAGCDSVVITTSILVETMEFFTTESVCTSTEARTDTMSIESIAGCDSLRFITDYIFTEVREERLTQTVCIAEDAGIDTVTFQSMAGCDSLIVITTSTFAESSESFITGTTCDATMAGIDTTFATNAAGCDSLVIRELTLLASNETVINSTTCNPNQVGIFTATLTNSVGCDSIVITNVSLLDVNDCEVQLNITTTDLSCNGERTGSILFSATVGAAPFNYTYENESGENGSGIINDTEETVELSDLVAGIYTIQVTAANGLTTTEIVTIRQPSAIEINALTFPPGCQRESGSILISSINGGNAPYAYALGGNTYQPIDEFPFRLPDALQGGDYVVQIRDANLCESSTIITVEERPNLMITLPDTRVIGLGDTVQLNPVFNFVPVTIEWETNDKISCTNCPNAVASPLNTNIYAITAIDDRGCRAKTNITIVVKKEREVYMPNIFSPNGDGNNDFFTIFTGNNVAKINGLRIYNYYGDPIFERLEPFDPNIENLGWDGTFRGKDAQLGTYLFIADIQFVDGFTSRFTGEFTLIR